MTIYEIELEELAKKREELKTLEKDIKKRIDKVNNEIIEKLGKEEDYTTDNYHFVRKIVIVPEHTVKESISQPLKVYNC